MSEAVLDSLREQLEQIVGSENISNSIYSPEPCKIVYAPGNVAHSPSLVVWPRNEKEVSEVIKLANKLEVPLVTWGGGTDRYSGGIIAPEGSLVLTTQKMNKIISVDTDCMVATVQSGITIEKLNEELSKLGLWWPHDPESKKYATVGGAISVNGVGTFLTGFGSAVDSVVGMRVVLPNGEIFKIGSYVKQSALGYDLLNLFTKAEGTLGVITEVTIKVRKLPETREYHIIKFKDIVAATNTAEQIMDSGLQPETLIIEDFTRFYNTITGIRIDSADIVRDEMKGSESVIIVSFSGSKEIVASSSQNAINICTRLGGNLLNDRRLVEGWWEAKTKYPPQIPTEAITKNMHVVEGIADGAVPLKYFPNVYNEFLLSLESSGFISYGARCYVNPYRDGVFSLVVAFDDHNLEMVEKFSKWVTRLSQVAYDFGGTMEAITGSGLKLVEHAKYELGGTLDLLKKIKYTLDPNGIMNTGKKFRF